MYFPEEKAVRLGLSRPSRFLAEGRRGQYGSAKRRRWRRIRSGRHYFQPAPGAAFHVRIITLRVLAETPISRPLLLPRFRRRGNLLRSRGRRLIIPIIRIVRIIIGIVRIAPPIRVAPPIRITRPAVSKSSKKDTTTDMTEPPVMTEPSVMASEMASVKSTTVEAFNRLHEQKCCRKNKYHQHHRFERLHD